MENGYYHFFVRRWTCAFFRPVSRLRRSRSPAEADAFPRNLESYNDADAGSIWAILKNRVKQEPFNLIATLIFLSGHRSHLYDGPVHGHCP